MRALRLIVAGLIAIGAVLAVVFAAIVVFFTGLAAYVLQLFRPKTRPTQSGATTATDRPAVMRDDEAIDVVTTKVPDETARR
ncbi:MAG: hypothetical protein HYV75_11690 [Opitutae bacterium]|nr:hypothetical protein [Opitutae bacterium]